MNNLLPIFNEFFNDDFSSRKTDLSVRNPSVSVSEKDGVTSLELEMPGMSKKDVALSYKEGYIVIKAEKKEETENVASYRKFQKSFYVGDVFDAENIDASMEDGILYIKLKRKEVPKGLNIDIN